METLIRELFATAVIVAAAPPALDDAALFAEEHAHLHGAVDKRRAEFTAARVCARRALAALQIGPTPLVPVARQGPAWPAGIVE
jgi:4'-phosphopantetheinyl transferase EntD